MPLRRCPEDLDVGQRLVACRRAERAASPPQHLSVPDDAGKRRAELVRHEVQELVLRGVRELQGIDVRL